MWKNFYYLKKIRYIEEIKEGDKIGKVSCEQVDDEFKNEKKQIECLIEGEYCLYKSGTFQSGQDGGIMKIMKTFEYLDRF